MKWLSAEATIEAFVEEDFLGNCNAMVRQLVDDPTLDSANPTVYEAHAREVTAQDFAKATQNISDHFLFAAPISHFDEALFLILRYYDLPLSHMFYRAANRKPADMSDVVPTQAVRDLILERNKFDHLLYEEQSRRFRLLVARLDSDVRAAFETIARLKSEFGLLDTIVAAPERRLALRSVYLRDADRIEVTRPGPDSP